MSEGDGGEHGVRAVRQAMVMTRQASGGGRLEPGGTAAAGDISMVNAAANPLLFMQSRQWHLLILSCLRANSPSTMARLDPKNSHKNQTFHHISITSKH